MNDPLHLLIQKTRKAKRLTQLQMANAVGVERSRISLIEGGARTSRRTAERIAAVLGLEIEQIFPAFQTLRWIT